MKSIAKLIKKEKLRSNYKLTFTKGDNVFFLILHESKRKIFSWLKINRAYSCWYEKGINYSFLRKIELENQKNTNQDIYLNDLLKNLTAETELSTVKQITLLLFKKYKADLNISFKLLSKQEQKEIKLIIDLQTLFFINRTS